jgi:hypothetical protein
MAISSKNKPAKKVGKKALSKKRATKKVATVATSKAKTTTKASPAAGKVLSKSTSKGDADRSAPPLAEVDEDVLEFIAAIDEFKMVNSRPFPSWSEVLLIVRQLGYQRS